MEIGSLGDSRLAAELEGIQTAFPASKGYEIVLFQNYQTHCYLFHIPQKGKDNLTIIDTETQRAQSYGYWDLESSDETVEELKELLKEMMPDQY